MLLKKIIRWLSYRPIVPMIKSLNNIQSRQDKIEKRLEHIQQSLGRIESRQVNNQSHFVNLSTCEFRVFSQWGEDGIIQFLINNIEIENKVFVEFGVENYTQANTRFLLVNNNWSGLVIDGSEENISQIQRSDIYFNYGLKAVQAFITKDNINELLTENGIEGEIGLLSVDIDGNDYWIWDAINAIDPVIVIAEYNHRFGKKEALTIPYYENFVRSKYHHSMIYFGASLKALCKLAKSKGYIFIGCNSNGVNAFFVRQDKTTNLISEVSPEEGYYSGQFCEVRNLEGIQTKVSPEEEKHIFNTLNLPLINVE